VITPPIILYETDGCGVEIYASVEAAAYHLEADYLGPADKYYDGEGRLLTIACDHEHGITFQASEEVPSHQEELRGLLVHWFHGWFVGRSGRAEASVRDTIGHSRDAIPTLPLSQLMEICRRIALPPPKPRRWFGF